MLTITAKIEALWYKNRVAFLPLLPLSYLFRFVAARRKKTLQVNSSNDISVPVIVVGNITVGGTGKTPVVIALVKFLQQQGFQPGVVSRGFGGQAQYPYQLNSQSNAALCGDEPLLIYKSCACPVVVSPNRMDAVEVLLANENVDVIISDDGLQHYALARDIEICVVDGKRQLGNGFCLPAGPLREMPSRLQCVDFVIMNGDANKKVPAQVAVDYQQMYLKTQPLMALPASLNCKKPVAGDAVYGVAAIGNPSRFYQSLNDLGFTVLPHSFTDHHQYIENELLFSDDRAVIMTEKDAVKCLHFKQLKNHFYLPVEAQLADVFWQALLEKLQCVIKNKNKGSL